jgi:EAL domain-containing protein (putative c-di-GMP-specific phosphodiesterase class I)
MNRTLRTYPGRPENVVTDAGSVVEGLDRGEFEVWYQPQLELVSGDLARFEALVRWRHPRHSLLLPDQFIPAAEASSEMVALDTFVLQTSVRELSGWRSRYPSTRVGVSVNLSSSQVLDPLLDETVAGALEENGVPAALLTVELAEAVLMVPGVAQVVESLVRLGVNVAVDGFGAGFSSLSRLRQLRIGYLKIARPLVAGLGRNADDTVVVEAIVLMAHKLGMKTVAEGVETLDQLGRLSDLGCDFAQGFYWSRAVLGRDAQRMVSRA